MIPRMICQSRVWPVVWTATFFFLICTVSIFPVALGHAPEGHQCGARFPSTVSSRQHLWVLLDLNEKDTSIANLHNLLLRRVVRWARMSIVGGHSGFFCKSCLKLTLVRETSENICCALAQETSLLTFVNVDVRSANGPHCWHGDLSLLVNFCGALEGMASAPGRIENTLSYLECNTKSRARQLLRNWLTSCRRTHAPESNCGRMAGACMDNPLRNLEEFSYLF